MKAIFKCYFLKIQVIFKVKKLGYGVHYSVLFWFLSNYIIIMLHVMNSYLFYHMYQITWYQDNIIYMFKPNLSLVILKIFSKVKQKVCLCEKWPL